MMLRQLLVVTAALPVGAQGARFNPQPGQLTSLTRHGCRAVAAQRVRERCREPLPVGLRLRAGHDAGSGQRLAVQLALRANAADMDGPLPHMRDGARSQ